MKYQLEHDKSLNAVKPFLYKETNEILTGISLWLRFEPKFESKETNPLIKVKEQMQGYNQLIKVGFNNEIKYSKAVAEKEESELTKELNKLVGFDVPMSYDTPIEKEEFDFIINNYGSLFENDNSLQTLGISWHEL